MSTTARRTVPGKHSGRSRRATDESALCASGGTSARRRRWRPASDRKPLSVALPVLNEQDNLEPLHARLVDALEPMAREYEVIYVDDGSTDGSWEALRKIAARDRRVRLVRLRRNFGQTPALAAGFAHSRYPIMVTLDADLQNDPDDIPRL